MSNNASCVVFTPIMQVFLNCPQQVRTLELVECTHVTDTCLQYVGVLRQLRRLKLHALGALTELTLKAISQLIELRELSLARLNRVSPNAASAVMSVFTQLPHLQVLILRHNASWCSAAAVLEFSQKFVSPAGGACTLQQLDVRGLKISAQQQHLISSVLPACSLYFDNPEL